MKEKPEPVFVADMRANLTDPLYEEMTANPDARVPFLVDITLVELELAYG